MNYENTPFKSPSGLYLTRGLFFETTLSDKKTVLYTLKDRDHEGYPSLYRLYMEENDPTEYSFAKKYLYGWEHWKLLTECTWFKDYVSSWREELSVRIESELLSRIRTTALTEGKEALIAARYLLERMPKKAPVGRPKGGSKAKTQAEEDFLEKELHSRVSEDYERILKETSTLKDMN